MAATLGCNTARVLYNAPVAGPRTSGEPSTSSISRLHLRGRRSKKLSLKLAGSNRGVSLARASLNNEGDKVRELASEKAVESGQQVDKDAKKLANGRQSPVELDAKADDAADAASDEGDVREKAVDVASDMAVDNSADVDALAKKDAGPLAEAYGRSVEDTAEALEAKAAELSDREARKESSSSSESGGNSSSFFQDQLIKEKVLDVASDSAVDERAEVEATAQKDAADMTSKIGGDQRRNKMTIEGMADTASKLEADRSGSEVEAGVKKSVEEGKRQFEGLTRTISKNLKEGIDASRPSLEELSKTASKGVKAGQENLDYAAEGAAELSGDAREVLDGAKGALDKRLKVINLAAEEARETGNLVAELAAKGWDALTKTTERFVGNFQKNVGDLQTTAEQKAQEAKVKAEETAQQTQSKLAEAKSTVDAKTDELKQKVSESKSQLEATAERAQGKFNEAKENAQTKTEELKDTAQEKASETKSKLEETADKAQNKLGEAKENVQSKAEDLKDTAQEKASESKSKLEETADKAQSKFGEAKENAQSKTEDLKNTAQEKASESKSKLEDTAETAKSKAGELSSSAKEKTNDVKENVESKAGAEKDSFTNAVDTMKDSQGNSQPRSVIGQTPSVAQGTGKHTGSGNGNGKRSSVIGQTPSVGYADSGKVNDEWKSKSQ